MTRRILPLAPLAPAIAVIAFAAAGAAAQGAAPGGVENMIEDVQVGEAGNLLRVALICRDECRVGARSGGVFYLPGVRAAFGIDLAGRSDIAKGLDFAPADGGSTMTVRSDSRILRASIKRCEVGAAPASCIDLEFAGEGAAKIAAAPPKKETGAVRQSAAAEPLPPAPADKLANALSRPPAPPAAAPSLRDRPDERLILANFARPERLAPPGKGAVSFVSSAALAARRPIIDQEKADAFLGGGVDIAGSAKTILGRDFSAAECDGARVRLSSDAWALDAMVDVGFCAAIEGDLEAADGMFIRLLEFTPDNYEALVGRALIAAKAGEKGVARKFFQDALNALPPIAESDRIVEAMAKL